ncbi:MAG: hypothetical protein ACR2N3_16265 [Pyrinomonadaceae bacterium]
MLINYEQQMREFVKRKDLKTFGSFIAEDWYGNLEGKEFTKPKLLEILDGKAMLWQNREERTKRETCSINY